MNIIMIIIGSFGLIALAGGLIAFNAAFYERERARKSHVGAMESRRVSDQYHATGKVMFQQALESYEDGQEFWSAATVALLDAKRREARADKLMQEMMENGQLQVVDRKEAV
jgi:hypothetical protein